MSQVPATTLVMNAVVLGKVALRRTFFFNFFLPSFKARIVMDQLRCEWQLDNEQLHDQSMDPVGCAVLDGGKMAGITSSLLHGLWAYVFLSNWWR